MAYLNLDDGLGDHPTLERLTDAGFREFAREVFTWSKTGQMPSGPAAQFLDGRMVRRSPHHLIPEPVRPPWRRYRAKISRDIRAMIYRRDGSRCLHCGSMQDLTLDHIIPWSQGGSDSPTNLQTLCRSCNAKKGARA